MYAGYFMVKLGPGMASVAQELADRMAPIYKASKGFNRVTFFGDYAAGEYGILSLWASKEDYEAFYRATEPQIRQVLAGMVEEPPVRKGCDVYEPKA